MQYEIGATLDIGATQSFDLHGTSQFVCKKSKDLKSLYFMFWNS